MRKLILTSIFAVIAFSQAGLAAGHGAGNRQKHNSKSTSTITVAGTFKGKPNAAYSMQFWLAGSCDSGKGHETVGFLPMLLGNGKVTTDGNGSTSYSFRFSINVTSIKTSGFVNGTATDSDGKMSSFSLCAPVTKTSTSG